MILDSNATSKVKVKMEKHVEAMLTKFSFPELINNKTASTPASEHLFKVNPNTTKLDSECADIFHKFVAKNLFLSQRSHLDIMSTVASLCNPGQVTQ